MPLFAIVIVGLLSSAKPAAQQNEVKRNFSVDNVSVTDFVRKLGDVFPYSFFIADEQVSKTTVSVNLKNATVDQVLSLAFAGKSISYTKKSKSITIALKKMPDAIHDAGKTANVKGTVVDESGESVIGATVLVEETKIGTVTDVNGRFEINAPVDGMLKVSYLGYTPEKIAIKGQTDFTVKMKPDNQTLDEVVVVGYGTQKKLNLTGAIDVITSEQIQDRPSGSVIRLLQGLSPNLNINMTSGRPGGSGTLNIRGATSINGGSPLVLVDGIEANLDQLNPNDIASFSILKDASAAAVYGARAAFGIILVTTKSGEDNKVKVNYNGSYGVGQPTTSTDFETRGYYSVYIADLFYRARTGTNYSNYTEVDMLEMWERRNDKTENPLRPWVLTQNRNGKESYIYYGNTDWYHYLYKKDRPMWNHNVSVSGGSEKLKFLVSGGFYTQDGIFRINTDTYKKANLRSKVTADINKYLSISNNTSFYRSNYIFPGAGNANNSFLYQNVHGLASYVPVNPDGTPVYMTIFNSAGVMDGWNALVTYGKHFNQDTSINLTNISEATFKPINGLEIKANFSYAYNAYTAMNRLVNIPYSQYPGEISYITTNRGENKLSENHERNEYYAANTYATYLKSFDRHNFSLMGGFNYETRHYKDVAVTGWNLLSDDLNDLNLAAIDETSGQARFSATGGQNEYAIMGGFGRFNYDYRGKYLFEASGRYDGSSKFMRGLRYGFFPSFSAGWRVSEESFFKPLTSVADNLKIRLSYGSLGNQTVSGYYPYVRTVSTPTLNYLFGTGDKGKYASFSAPVASDISWETVTTRNLGIDLGFFRSRLNFSADFYIRDTEGMLVPGKTLPSVYGAGVPRENAADLRAKGYEWQLSWKDQFNLASKPFKYGISFSLGDNTATITRFDNPNKMLTDYYEGQALGEIWGYKTDGLFATDAEAAQYSSDVDMSLVNQNIVTTTGSEQGWKAGDIKFLDLNGDHKVSQGDNRLGASGDKVVIGNSEARYRYGIGANAAWNGFDLSLFFQGIGRQNWWPTRARMFFGPYDQPYATFIHKDFYNEVWREDNPDAYFPRARGYAAQNANSSLTVPTDRYLQDLAYIRLKSLNIAYSLPSSWTNKVLIDKLRIYFSGENLVTFTKLHSKVIDPEQASATGGSSDAIVYPFQRVYAFGIDITF
ncbi:MAG: TonB-dependent receptor [Dysgonamonadaceae bacterium]|nr:TonB-dependent receptor [Dysgonamonadaceae bacterium]